MKIRLKKKTDKTKTGNKRINPKTWEKILLDLMEGDNNPTIVKVPGARQCGLPSLPVQVQNEAGSLSVNSTSSVETLNPVLPKTVEKNQRSILRQTDLKQTKLEG